MKLQAGMKVASTVDKIITQVSGLYTVLFTILARTLHDSPKKTFNQLCIIIFIMENINIFLLGRIHDTSQNFLESLF